MNVYPPFKDKLEILSEDQIFSVLVSFDDLSNRDKFIKKYNRLDIISKFDFIPSILVNLKKEQIFNYESEALIKQIEENQIVYPAMLDVNKILELDDYKKSEISYTGKNVKVGIIDNGINEKIPALSKVSLKKFKLYDVEKPIKENGEISHGTVMASIISNRFEDSDGNYIGIAPNVKIYDFDISNSHQEHSFNDILRVFDKICEEQINLDIIFISLTTKNSSDGKDLLSLACDLLSDKNIIIVCPSGNFGPNYYTIGSPGAAKKVITIGALDKELSISNFSGRGPTLDKRKKPDLCFPGSNILVPITNDLRLNVSGTSVATATGVGVIALIKEYDSNITHDLLMDLFNKSKID
ncbi:MAG: S8 family serine peptidase, partial [Candidatus Lokiarchaeia archaeon]|nr:S8 family serine peptidase [Candidatus Lokiarchaeia archaeon]